MRLLFRVYLLESTTEGMANTNKDKLWERVERVACTVVCRVTKFAEMSTHEIEEKVLEKAEAIFLEWSIKMVGLSSSAPASVPAATT